MERGRRRRRTNEDGDIAARPRTWRLHWKRFGTRCVAQCVYNRSQHGGTRVTSAVPPDPDRP
eukprot:3991722-Pyramimonas_sp.AAC.1